MLKLVFLKTNLNYFTMKKITTIIAVLIFGIISSKAQKVFSVDYKSDADVKVFVADYKSDADLVVYKCDYKSDASGNEGKWYFVDYKSDADLVIFFSTYKSDAGWKNSSKKQLMY